MKHWYGVFYQCDRRRISLNEYFGIPGPETFRQFQAWGEFYSQDWNHPTRDNYYLMAIRYEVRMFREGFAKNPKQHELESFKIPFKLRDEKEEKQEAEERVKQKLEMSKQMVIARMGKPLAIRQPGRTTQIEHKKE